MDRITIFAPISGRMTKEKYIRLAIRWAQTGGPGNAPIDGITWNGEDIATYGTGKRKLSIVHSGDAVSFRRHEEKERPSAILDAEFTADFGQKLFTMRLYRTYPAGIRGRRPILQPPSLISFMVQNGFFNEDGRFPVANRPVRIGMGNADAFIKAVLGNSGCMQPIVFVAPKEDGSPPVDMAKLSTVLRGVAHIFVGMRPEAVEWLRLLSPCRLPKDGGIGLYFSDGARRFLPPGSKHLLEDTASIVSAYIEKSIPLTMPAWKDVENMVLRTKFAAIGKDLDMVKSERDDAKKETEKIQASLSQERENLKREAESEAHTILDSFDEDMKKLNSRIEALENENTALQCENTGLRARIGDGTSNPVLMGGKERDLYDGEIKDIILSTLSNALKALPEGTRRADVLKDMIDANGYQRLGESKMEGLKGILKGSGKLSATDIAKLEELGFIMTKNSRHYKLVYYGDKRYQTVIGKTPSDRRAGINNDMEIIRSTLYIIRSEEAVAAIIGNGWHGATIVPNAFIDIYMESANDLQLKSYLHILRRLGAGMETGIQEIADEFNSTEKDVIRSLKYWEKKGLFRLSVAEDGEITSICVLRPWEQQEHPDYAVPAMQDVPSLNQPELQPAPSAPARMKKEKPAQPPAPPALPSPGTPAQPPAPHGALQQQEPYGTIGYTEKRTDVQPGPPPEPQNEQILFIIEQYIGKPLSLPEVNAIQYITGTLGFSNGLLDYLVQYCVDRGKRDFRYIKKVAENWSAKGIMTPVQAETAMADEEQRQQQRPKTTRPYRRNSRKSGGGGQARYNAFIDFEQNSYDFDELEEELLSTSPI